MSSNNYQVYKPSKEEIIAAREKRVPDVIAPGLKILFCGINPGLYSAAVGHHFARPGNRFWKMLQDAGFTPRLLSPFEDGELLKYGYGITNIAERATARADELSPSEFAAGAQRLEIKVLQYYPKFVAFLGIGAYRQAFARPHAQIGLQDENLGNAKLWVLPNPSGLNGQYQPERLKKLSQELLEALET